MSFRPHLTPDGLYQLAARIVGKCAEDLATILYRTEGVRDSTNQEFIGHVRWEVGKAVDDVLFGMMIDAGIHLEGEQRALLVDLVTKTALASYEAVVDRELSLVGTVSETTYVSGPSRRFVDDDFPF